MTERVSDAVAQVANPQNHGIISDDGYNTAKTYLADGCPRPPTSTLFGCH